MSTSSRVSALAPHQLTSEFRSRLPRGFRIDHTRDLARLVDDIGAPVWLSRPTAAALHSFDGFRLAEPHHVLVPRWRNIRRIGVIVHTTQRLDRIDRAMVDGLPVTSAARTLIDLASMTPQDAMTAALDGALRDGLVSESFLHARIAQLRGKGRHGVPALLSVIEGAEITRGAHSWLERELLRLVAAAKLPPPLTQQVLGRRGDRLIRVDFRWPGTPVVVEVMGYRWHTADQQKDDLERANRLTLDGFLVIQLTYRHVVEEPVYVVERIVEALTLAC
jgi:very-short-patch-repair endonuclease